MMRPLRISALVALVSAGLLLAAAPASAGPSGISLKIAKKQSGPYDVGVRVNIAEGAKKNVYLKAKNRGDSPLGVDLFGPDSDGDYRVKYYKLNGTNITDDVASGGGYSFNVQGGKAKTFRMKIKAKDGTEFDCIGANVIFDGGGDDSVVVGVNLPQNVACVL